MSHALHPKRRAGAVCILALTANLLAPQVLAAPIDEFRLSDIEQRIRQLETLTREHSRQLSSFSPLTGARNTPAPTSVAASGGRDLLWINATSWNSIKPGMSELQVIELLGPATQMRTADDNQSRHLLYTVEIGRSGYLSGRVSFSKGIVTAVEIPTLR